MIDFVDFINKLKNKYEIYNPAFMTDFTTFLVSNNWFGVKPVVKEEKLYVDDKDLERITNPIEIFCFYYRKSYDEKKDYLNAEFEKYVPETSSLLGKYLKSKDFNDRDACRIIDFLLKYLVGEIHQSTDKEIEDLLDIAFDELPKACSDIIAEFINFVKDKRKTVYNNIYFMNKYYSDENLTEAYDQDRYLQMMYYLFNDEYITDNEMYLKAADSKNYIDTWLFLSLHFLCALRNTDLIRIPHPRLNEPPIDILRQIKEGSFSDAKAILILNSVIYHLDFIMLTPNKTKRTSGVASIKLHIPSSLQVHIGRLFAIAEAHYQLNLHYGKAALIRSISSYEEITRYMGEEIGELFLESNFSARKANKSYLQMIFLLTDDILEANDEFHVKGYMLASLARSHKGAYGDFAKTTSIYLKDAKMNGYTPEFVAKEMFERGVLSLIPSMLLKMITNGEYQKLSVESQTKLIKSLNMSPLDIEKSVKIMQDNVNRSLAIVKKLYQENDKTELLNILHRIGNGEGVSKCDGSLCLLTAMGKLCPYTDIQNCIICDYEISTKSTLFLMVNEIKRLNSLYLNTKNAIEKNRYKTIAENIVIPSIEEMLTMVETSYGKEGLAILEAIISEETN